MQSSAKMWCPHGAEGVTDRALQSHRDPPVQPGRPLGHLTPQCYQENTFMSLA